MKIYVHRTHTICDGLVIRWNPRWPFRSLAPEISASRNGVMVSGHWELKSPEAIAAFQAAVVEAVAARAILGREGKPARFPNEVDVPFGDSIEDVIDRAEAARG